MPKKSVLRFFTPVLALALAMWAGSFSLGCKAGNVHVGHEAVESHDEHDGHDHGTKGETVEDAWAADTKAIEADPEGELKKALEELKADGKDSNAAMRVWRIAQYDLARIQDGKAEKEQTLNKVKDYLLAAKAAGTDINFDVREMIYEETARVAFSTGDLDAAEKAATDLLSTFKDPEEWVYGNAVHEGNMVLGQVAAARKDFDSAAKFLLEAGKSPGSPQLKSYGPQFPLALTLERHGKQAEVAQYLEGIRTFWKDEHVPVEKWIKDLKAGKAPSDEFWKAHTRGL
jgi:tetratricopeptide (TPR) repeat protein